MWIVDFDSLSQSEAAMFEAPWAYVDRTVRPQRAGNREQRSGDAWWQLQRARPEMKASIASINSYIATARVAKYRLFVRVPSSVLPDSQVVAFARADDATFGILHSRFHELWSLRMCTWMGKGNDPRYTPTTCFETFPFPEGLTPADTAHQRTETIEGGACIPADLAPSVRTYAVRTHAETTARAAHQLTHVRDSWLNPPEWAVLMNEVVPLGMERSPYPDRIVARTGFEAELSKRTLTNLYNQRPTWLVQAHAALDAAVAAAYGWADWTAAMTDDEILVRLLALNRERRARMDALTE